MKVVVLGDSFGLPRMYKHSNEIEVKYEETYPEQLRQMLSKEFLEDILLLNHSKRYKTSYDLIQDWTEVVYLNQPDYLILQIGIVDCWPRDGIKWAPHQEWVGKSPWVFEDEYVKNIEEFIRACSSLQCLKSSIFVNIPRISSEAYEKHSGSYERTIIYNNRLCEIIQQTHNAYLVDVFQSFESGGEKNLCSDGVHPNNLGNKNIAESIFVSMVKTIYKDKICQAGSLQELEEGYYKIQQCKPLEEETLKEIYQILDKNKLESHFYSLYSQNRCNPSEAHELAYKYSAKQGDQKLFNSLSIRLNPQNAFNQSNEIRDYQMVPPSTFVFEVTNYCNLRCPMCSHTYMKERKTGFMSKETFHKALEMVRDYAQVIRLYSSGEPLLHREILYFIKEIKNQGIKVVVSTNATMLNDKFLQKLAISNAIPDTLQLSIEGWDKTSYEFFRKGAQFEKTVENVALLKDYRDGLRWRMTILAHCLLTKETDCEAFYQQWQPYVDHIKLDLMSPPRFFKELADERLREMIFYARNNSPKRLPPCSLPFTEMTLGYDGKVSACCGDFDFRLLMGDINECKSIEEIWNNDLYKRLRFDQWNGRHETSRCKGCHVPYFRSDEDLLGIVREKSRDLMIHK